METKKLISQPNIRHEVYGSIEALINKDWDKIAYYKEGPFTVYFDYLLMRVYHTLYDDNELDEKEYALENIGRIFYNEEEALAVYEFCYWFHELTDVEVEEIEPHKTPNEAYFNHPEWPKVWSGAEELIKLMEDNNNKYDIQASWDFWEYHSCTDEYFDLIEKENAKYAAEPKKKE